MFVTFSDIKIKKTVLSLFSSGLLLTVGRLHTEVSHDQLIHTVDAQHSGHLVSEASSVLH